MGGSKCDFLFSGYRLLARDLGRVVGSREFLVAFSDGRFLSEPDAKSGGLDLFSSGCWLHRGCDEPWDPALRKK